MYIVLLSGGSGKRLWPLSNDLCSKQYIKLMNPDEAEHSESTEKCSMLQRVFGQLKAASLSENTIVCASDSQVELIESQLDGQAEVAVEPMRRNTFPAVMLSCAYLLSNKGAKPDDVVAFLPVDPYTTVEFFNKIKSLGEYIEKQDSVIGLLGGVPTYPSTKYGYIVPEKNGSEPFAVKGFREKPDEATAQSFDYEVLEHWKNIVAVQYDGIWKDLGTWNTLTEEMKEQSIGDVTWDKTCENSHAINVLGVPMVVMGAKNMVIVASHDGILVADKHQSSYIKDCLENIPDESRFEERRWGTIKTIDNNDEDGTHSVTKRIKILAGKTMPYHTHAQHTETITVISGMGKLILEGTEVDLLAGSTVSIASGKKHSIKALGSDLRLIEVSLGVTCDDEQVLG